MLSVYKYQIPLELDNDFSLELPKGAKILTVQIQNGKPQIWALVSQGQIKETRKFYLAGTGLEIDVDPKSLNYIGTLQLANGKVGHLFEIK